MKKSPSFPTTSATSVLVVALLELLYTPRTSRWTSIDTERNRNRYTTSFSTLRRPSNAYRMRLYGTFRDNAVSSGELIGWVRVLYSCPNSRVQPVAETSVDFSISLGVHQGSMLSQSSFLSSWMHYARYSEAYFMDVVFC